MVPDVNDPLFWVDRLAQRLMARQAKYSRNHNYAIGEHPLPINDRRYERVLSEIQKKARTNYVALANRAVTERMRVKGFRFGDPTELDQDARKIWDANNMSLKSVVAISDAATLSDAYALVSPPGDDGIPVITIEDPRTCIVEPDPMDPMKSIAGLKFWEDSVLGIVVAVLYMPDFIYLFHGPTLRDFLARDLSEEPLNVTAGASAYRLQSVQPNKLGKVPLIRNPWRPEFGVVGMAECEDGGFDVQDRMNVTTLHRLTVGGSQAFRQRWVTGMRVPKNTKGKGGPLGAPFRPDQDMVWAVQDPDAKFGDFDQADIRQMIEAAEADVGNFAAITQTPVTYLTNKMINVSASAMTAAQSSLTNKIRSRKQPSGWFFEEIMKTAFLYLDDHRASEVAAETVWEDHEDRSMAEIADMISKLLSAGVPVQPTLEYAGVFSEEQIKLAVEEAEKAKLAEQEMADKQLQAKQQPPDTPKPSSSR